MSHCIFCDILAGKAPVSLVYQDDRCAAFMDIQPVNPGHLLVIPKHHAPYLADLDEQTGGHLFQIAQRLAGAVRKTGVRCEGVNIFLADGEVAGQEVFHVHLHVMPRYGGDGFGFKFGPDYSVRPSRSELDAISASIQGAL
jgi:histidine triad (HIT) family protein